jgi:molybdenum cofactor synthesis domain-containing protein
VAGIERSYVVKTAALIVIGDEILTGKVKDENSFIFTQAMFDRGIRVWQILVIPDDIDIIAASVCQYSKICDYVFTSGGVGPTHDDKTFDGIALGFNLPIKRNERAFSYFREAQKKANRGDNVSEAQMKMLCFPDPCQVYFMEPLWLPLVVVNNVYVFPGVPFLFETMIKGFLHLFDGGKFYRQTIFTDRTESKIALDLKTIQDQNPDVSIGSYPQMPGKPYNVMVTIEGVEEDKVHHVLSLLLPLIDGRQNMDAK